MERRSGCGHDFGVKLGRMKEQKLGYYSCMIRLKRYGEEIYF